MKNFDEVVKLDVAYIDGWTIWKDIEILLKTVKVVFMRDGAK
ncbi:TPA: sugar transferase [Streptococcus pneumoniae]